MKELEALLNWIEWKEEGKQKVWERVEDNREEWLRIQGEMIAFKDVRERVYQMRREARE